MSKKVVEYRIHYGEDGDSHNVLIYEGKDWRKWEQHIGEEGVQWIERVEDVWCEHSCSVIDSEYEVLWEVEQ